MAESAFSIELNIFFIGLHSSALCDMHAIHIQYTGQFQKSGVCSLLYDVIAGNIYIFNYSID